MKLSGKVHMLQNTINSITVGLHGSSTTAYLPHSIVPAPVARSKLTLVPCLNCRRQTPSSPRTAGANGAPSGRSYLKLQNNRRFSIENRRFPGTIVHNLCIFNRKFKQSWNFYCNSLLRVPSDTLTGGRITGPGARPKVMTIALRKTQSCSALVSDA